MSETRRNPFPGLRPFEFHEHELFFGREEQYEQMVAKLSGTRFLAVVGRSGSGKSSLVRAGLLPALYGGQMMSAGTNWRIALFRPKDDPIQELALALSHRRVFGSKFKENGSPLFSPGDVIDWAGLCAKLSSEAQGALPGPAPRILELLPLDVRRFILETGQKSDSEQISKADLIQAFNGVLGSRDFHLTKGFERIIAKGEAQVLLKQGHENLSDAEVAKLNRLLLEAYYPQEIAKSGKIQTKITEVTLRRGDLGLVEAVSQAKMSPDENLLVVVDQFEELFRYARISGRGLHGNQAAAFVKLLLQARNQKDFPIYIVLTMRSEYLGECAKFWDLPEAINDGQYLIPRLTREQCREAIRGPIKVRGADITPQLVNQLLSDMGPSPDQLPILQHVLMRIWARWESENRPDEPLDVRHYDAVGRMAGALSLHAEEAYGELPDERSREVAEKLFKCLTEDGAADSEVRRPTDLRELRAVTGAKLKELVTVINVFRRDGRSFLLPTSKKPLTRQTSVDISHESLIRNWKRLKKWVAEETASARTYRRLAETAKLYEVGRAGPMSYQEVQDALAWRERNKPNAAWAARYHYSLGDAVQDDYTDANSEERRKECDKEIFERAMAFLEESLVACEKAVADQEKRHKKEIRQKQIRKFASVLSALFVLTVVACVIALWQWSEAATVNKANNHITYGTHINLAQRAFETLNFAEGIQLLDAARKFLEKDKEHLGFEWYHLRLRYDNESMALQNDPKHPLMSVAVSPDGNLLAAATGDGRVTLRGLTGEARMTLEGGVDEEGRSSPVLSMAFSADGKTLATGSRGGSIKLWATDTEGAPKLEKACRRGGGSSVAFIPNSDEATLAFGCASGEVTLVNIASGDSRALIRSDQNSPIAAIAFSPDKRTLAVGGEDGVVELWELPQTIWKTNQPLKATPVVIDPTKNIPIKSLAFNSDGQTLAVGREDSNIVLLDMAQRQRLVPLTGHGGEVLSVMFSGNDQLLASGSWDGSVILWDMRMLSDQNTRRDLRAAAFSNFSTTENSPDATDLDARGELIKAAKNGSAGKVLLKQRLSGHADVVSSVAFLPDSKRFVSGGRDGVVKLWEVKEVQEPNGLATLRGYQNTIRSVAFPKRGAAWLATGDKDGVVKLWDLTHNQSGGSPGGTKALPHGGDVSSVAFSDDGKMLGSGGSGGVVKLWDVPTGELRATLLDPDGDRSDVLAVAFSPDGNILASGNRNKIVRLWDVKTGKKLTDLIGPDGAVLSVAFSPLRDSRLLAAGSADNKIYLWDVDTGTQVTPGTMQHEEAVVSVTFSGDGQTLATGSRDRTAKLWDVWAGESLATFAGHSRAVTSVTFTPKNTRLVTASEDGSLKLWDISDDLQSTSLGRRELVTWKQAGQDSDAFSWALLSVAISSDGNILAIGSADNTVLLRYAAPAQDSIN
ncbi:MAG: hypothetical protein M3416_02220 [Acidobacteriota bacterium]|nr:hypothetical protein [Acidobacteriota bacterium]